MSQIIWRIPGWRTLDLWYSLWNPPNGHPFYTPSSSQGYRWTRRIDSFWPNEEGETERGNVCWGHTVSQQQQRAWHLVHASKPWHPRPMPAPWLKALLPKSWIWHLGDPEKCLAQFWHLPLVCDSEFSLAAFVRAGTHFRVEDPV